MCKEGRRKTEEECGALREKGEALEREHQTLRLELTSEIDELKLKVCAYLYTGQSFNGH